MPRQIASSGPTPSTFAASAATAAATAPAVRGENRPAPLLSRMQSNPAFPPLRRPPSPPALVSRGSHRSEDVRPPRDTRDGRERWRQGDRFDERDRLLPPRGGAGIPEGPRSLEARTMNADHRRDSRLRSPPRQGEDRARPYPSNKAPFSNVAEGDKPSPFRRPPIAGQDHHHRQRPLGGEGPREGTCPFNLEGNHSPSHIYPASSSSSGSRYSRRIVAYSVPTPTTTATIITTTTPMSVRAIASASLCLVRPRLLLVSP